MSVAPYFPPPSARDRVPKSPRHSRNSRVRNQNPSPSSRPKITKLPTQKLPPKLRSLLWLQKGTFTITLGLVVTTLAMYASSVYIPKLWSKQYQQLQMLQRYERDLTATNEALKNQIAQQAEKPEMGLTKLDSAHVIFITPATNSPVKPIQPSTAQEKQPLIVEAPLAY